MKKLIIILNIDTVKISIEEKNIEIARDMFSYGKNLSEELLVKIDSLLDSSRIQIQDIDNFECKINQPESYTSTRIVKAITESFKWAKKVQCQPHNCG